MIQIYRIYPIPFEFTILAVSVILRTPQVKKKLEIIGFCLVWLVLIGQFILMMQNRTEGVLETVVRFFSFFTISTNGLVALFFTATLLKFTKQPFVMFLGNGAITAISSFILVVGLIYQVVLRNTWEPKGLQLVVDESLHTLIPLYFFIYWFLFVKMKDLDFGAVFRWLLYPLFYILFILLRGSYSGFYPYPFVRIPEIGFRQVFINSILIFAMMLFLSIVLVLIGRKFIKKK